MRQLVFLHICDKSKNESLRVVLGRLIALGVGAYERAWGSQILLPIISGCEQLCSLPQYAIQILPCSLCAVVWKRLASTAVKVLTLLPFHLDSGR